MMIKKIIKLNIFVLVLLSCTNLFSQQDTQITQYMFNPISINPAYAGSRQAISILGLYRNQWAGLNGGPITQVFSIHSPMKNENVGLGFSFINEEIGFENFSKAHVDYSYTINIGYETKLAFGLKASVTSYSLDQELRDAAPNDLVIQNIKHSWNPNIGMGLFLHSNKGYIGLSAPRILNVDYDQTEEFSVLERNSYFLTAGLLFDINNNLKLKPSFLVRQTNGAPISYDLSAHFLFNEKLWLGTSYRFNESTRAAVAAMVNLQISKQLTAGYAYETSLSNLGAYSNNTHEIILMFEIFKNKRIISPRYF